MSERNGEREASRKRQRREEVSENGSQISSAGQGQVSNKIWQTYLEELGDPMKVDTILTELHNINQSRKMTIIFDYLLSRHYLQTSSVMEYCLVSPSWNNAVRTYLENHPSHLDLNGSYFLSRGLQMFFLHQKENNADPPSNKEYYFDIDKVISKYPAKTNPFPGRHVNFCIVGNISANLTHSQSWCRKTVTLLERYGREVWYFAVYFSEDTTDPCTAYRVLRQWTGLMPNLKALKIFYEDYMHDGAEVELDTEIAKNPFPQLEHLVFLTAGNVPHPIFNEIAAHVPKDGLKKLRINPNSTGICQSNANGIDKYDWTQLGDSVQEASITVESRLDFLKLESAVEQWPLQRLFLDLDIPDRGSSFDGEDDSGSKWINWCRIFSFLEKKFGSTLTDIELDLPREGRKDFMLKKVILEHSLKHRVNLVHVKKFHVKIYNVTAIDFLLPMRDSLENLYIEFCLVDWSEVDSQALEMIREKEIIKLHSSKIFRQRNTSPKEAKVKIDDEFNVTSFMRKDFPKLKRGVMKFSNCVAVMM